MRTKTITQVANLTTGIDTLTQAARQLTDAGEPSLALAVLSLRLKADLARGEAVVRPASVASTAIR